MKKTKFVSVHGGHSGQFCSHARDTLDEIVQRYIELKFEWIGITDHVYPLSNQFRYPDEAAAGLDVANLTLRFTEYITTCRLLQKKYQDKITIFTAFETETYSGYKEFIPSVIRQFQPDYVVGSVHHVNDICIDYSKEDYNRVADDLGGVSQLYCQYFDIQYDMIKSIEPAVVGHFDLIRLFDENYSERLKSPEIWQRITRNLDLIRQKNLIMDFNLRALLKGASEPYISAPILAEAQKRGILVLPGDDSHGIKDPGVNMEHGIEILRRAGFDTDWQKPSLYMLK
ncbi:MAG: histidinol-phosphatase [Desulfamplus sp.]|nr:histidinol-phosphatase [Desulfamplus sp.]